jgi:hypothetical protein
MNINSFSLNKQSGLALILALIFLQILAILGLFSIENSIETEKMSRLAWQQSSIFFIAEQKLNAIEMLLQKNLPNCLIPVISENALLTKPLNWWRSVGCTGQIQDFEYYYLIEKLDIDPCAELKSLNKMTSQNSTLQYLRISLLMLNTKNESKEILQSTIITLDNTKPLACNGPHHVVALGRQMWREPR